MENKHNHIHEHEEHCCCGHDHEHEHEHNHEHEHEHDEHCCCGHDHEHEHEHEHHDHAHEHDEHCCCDHGHDHDHDHHHDHDHDHGHHHDHGCGCACCQQDYSHLDRRDDQSFVQEHKAEIVQLIIGAALFVIALVMEHFLNGTVAGIESWIFVLGVCIVAYVLLGHEVLMNSARNIARGQVFDENFLMSIATLAAFCIGDFPEAVGVMLFYNVGEMFEHISVDRSRRQIAEAVDMRPETVNLLCTENHGEDHDHDHDHGHEEHHDHDHHEHIHVVPAEDIKIGDILVINPGDRIPLDGEVFSGEGIIDTSPVTGEPTPVHAKAGDKLISGSINQRGKFNMKVTAPLAESMVSKILNAVENASENKPEIEKFITKFARVYTPIVCVLALLVAILPPMVMGAAWKYWIVTAITFLVISCPCAMVISVPLAYFLGVGTASKSGILVKSGQALEALRKIKIVAMDKTGTITKGVVENTGLLDVEGTAATDKKTVILDELKDDAKSGIAAIKKLNMKTAMLTGDKAERAGQIAADAGIDEIKSELLPDDKLTALWELRKEHGEIMYVGDGINDAPVLAGADVSAAMGSGADAAIDSADIVFMNSNVGAIPEIIKIANKTGKIAKQNIALALIIKILVIILGAIGFANIWFAVFADTGVAMLCILNSLRLLK